MSDGRGGAREGAGRKPSGKRKAVFYITEEEEKHVRLEIERLRAKEKYNLPSFQSILEKHQAASAAIPITTELEARGQTTMLTELAEQEELNSGVKVDPGVNPEPKKEKCPKCGEGWLVLRHRGNDGKPFMGCSTYPACKYSRDVNGNG